MNYYIERAKEFFEDTVNVDMTTLYQEFLPLLTPRGLILDAGCGSGRDTKAFIQKKFSVYSIDSSKELAKLAEDLTNQKVEITRFQDFQTNQIFDGIWASASLLHVPMSELSLSFKNLANPLKSNGIFYCSFKYGNEEIEYSGRNFTNLNESQLEQVISESSLEIHKTWCTSDLRKGRENEKWLNAILIKRF
jgi:trans-aconitate methyltransferase